ncbi:MAG: mechanosensitive ion channel, partial [Planctomycetota bacterium]|nr:mechanosensitive ion channel [Planctomycetota bacterium]
MRSFKLLLFFLCVLSAPAALAPAQDAIDLDDDALLDRVAKEIDALVLAGDKADADKKALDENDASLKEAQAAANAPLPAEPGEIADFEGLDEQSLLDLVQVREEYLGAYSKRKEQRDRIPSLTDARRKMITQAMEAFRSAEQRAGDLRPLLTELARRVEAGRISQDKSTFHDEGVEFWKQDTVQRQVECAALLETYSAEKQLPESRPAPEPAEPTSRSDAVWNLETQRRLQHSLDVATILLEAARHEATERKELEQPDYAALPAAMALVHGEWGWERDEYQKALDRVGAKRKELADLETNRRELASPSKESIPEGEGHAELKTARRNSTFSDKLVEHFDARLNLRRQASDLAKELAEALAAVKPVFERARHQTIKLKVTLDMVARRQRDGDLATVEVPQDVSVSSLAAYMWKMADLEAARRREVEELEQRQDKKGIDAAGEELDKEEENNQRLHDLLEEELSYAEVLEEMATESETNLIALLQPDGIINEAIDKMNAEVQDAQRELDRAEQGVRDIRDTIRSVENPYVRKGYRIAPHRLAAIKAELQDLDDGRLPEDRSSDPLVRKTAEDPAELIGAGADESSEEDQTLLEQAESAKKALKTLQGFATLHWLYFEDLDQKIKEYTEALDATEGAFELTDRKRSALINAEKRKYACALELRRRLDDGRIDRSQVSFDLSKARTREAITKVQSDRGERARAYNKRRKSHQDQRETLQAIAGLGEWAKIRADFANKKATRISQPVQLIEAASMLFENLAPVDRKRLDYDAKNQREADDVVWESLLASVVPAKKRELFDESLDTFYLTIARIDDQLRDYATASEAYQDLIELCETELDLIEDAPEKLKDGLRLRSLSYQTARYLAAVAASPSAQLTIEDAFKQEFGSPLPIPEETHDWDKDRWADRLHEAEAHLRGHQSWTKEVDNIRSKGGLEAKIERYEQYKAEIQNRITELELFRKNHHSSIAEIRSDYSKEIRSAALWTLGSLVLIPLLAWILVRLVNHFARRIEERVVDGMARDRLAYHERMKTLSSVTRKTVSVVVWIIAGLYLLHRLGTPVSTLLASAGVLGLAFAFGAQSLIRDFFHGFFILLENQYTIGDWIKVGSIEGTVERLTLRVTVLRDMEGTLH